MTLCLIYGNITNIHLNKIFNNMLSFNQIIQNPETRKFNIPTLYSEILIAKTTKNGRIYSNQKTNKSYISVTTFLSKTSPSTKKSLDRWRKRVGVDEANMITKKATNRGNKLHKAFEHWLKNELVPAHFWESISQITIENCGIETIEKIRSSDYKNELMQFRNIQSFFNEEIETLLGNELSLHSDKLKLAGQLDICYKNYNGKIILADLKTTSKPKKDIYLIDHKIQLTIYALMLYELFNIEVDYCMNYYCYSDGTNEEKIFNPYDYLELLETRHNNYFKNLSWEEINNANV